MNRAAASLLIPFASVVLSATVFAQSTPTPRAMTSAPPSVDQTNSLVTVPSSSCPIGLRAQPGVGPGMVVVVNGHDAASQKLNLQFSNPGSRGVITRAQITVHGLTAQGRLSPIVADRTDASTVAKDVDLVLTVAPGANASTDVLFKGITSVRWIDLDSLTYADGSTWSTSPGHACQITPDRVMLIASH